MNHFINSCNAATTYPKNLISPSEYQHTLQTYVDELNVREEKLFDTDDKAALDFWDLGDGAASTYYRYWNLRQSVLTRPIGFQLIRTKPQELENHIHFPPRAPQPDPRCRYV